MPEYMPDVEFPDPTQEHAKWLLDVSQCNDEYSLRDYRALGRKIKKGRIWTIEIGQRLNAGLANKVIAVGLRVKDYGDGKGPARINHFFMSEDAKAFWQTGRENGQSADDILKGWESLQSIMADAAKTE